MFRLIPRLTLIFVGLSAVYAAAAANSSSTATKIPDIEKQAKDAMAQQWVQLRTTPDTPAPWEACLKALDLATRPNTDPTTALTVLESGYAGTKHPYAVPAEDSDAFWDWLAGAAPNVDSVVTDKTKMDAALTSAEAVVDAFYLGSNQKLMNEVDANFSAKNPRRAIFELLNYAAGGVSAASAGVRDAQITATEKQAEASRAASLLDKVNAQTANSTDATVNALKALVKQNADEGQKAANDAGMLLKNTVTDLNNWLEKLQSIRLCYASVAKGANGNILNYSQKLADYVSGKFHR